VVLSSILRGGSPTAFDRTLGLKFGAKAMELADERQFGMMVSLQSTEINAIPMEDVAGKIRTVPESLYRESMLFMK
jgi:6-phosphofructokinase 1